MKTVLAIRHVAFEDLGSLEPLLLERGFALRYLEAGVDDLAGVDPLADDLLVVLGGPISVYEADIYPFIADELALLRVRLAADRPTLGICLGAQMMAAALGARVYSGGTKEIGWTPLTLTDAGVNGPLRHLVGEGCSMLHWHGDTFELPEGAELLASTPLYPHQAFGWGARGLAFQCHPEVRAGRIETWLIGHAAELGQNRISVPALREASLRFGPVLENAGRACLAEWLDGVMV
ncbi:MAG: glutamine amidotransferase [Magnetococcales bacterium]|nr:glutamine amidotransferase [Magnetococcales bacterium]